MTEGESASTQSIDRDAESSGVESYLQQVAEGSEAFMDILELLTAVVMVVLFAIGVYDIALKLMGLIQAGTFTDPNEIIKLIDVALLLLIIVEIYRTVVAYIEDLNILPLVLQVALIAMARKIISFRTGKYPDYTDALLAATAYGLLMIVLIATFYLIHRGQEATQFDIYSEPFSSLTDREQTGEPSDD